MNAPDNGPKEASFGVEVYPRLALNLPLERSIVKASYDLRLDYYEARPRNNVDTEHQVELALNHRFTERNTLDLDETFISASQPEVSSGTTAQTTFQRGDRANYSHWRNYFRATYDFRLTPTYGGAVGLRSSVYDYQQTGLGGLSALLDRTENELYFEAQLFPSEHSRYFVGYQFGWVDYTSNDQLFSDIPAVTVVTNGATITTNVVFFRELASASLRNSLSQYGYVGVQRLFSPRLTGSLSVGVRYTDFYNQNITDLSPYVDLSGTVGYLPGSSLTIGAKVDRNATDSGLGLKGITRDQLSLAMFLTVRHRLTARFFALADFRYQHSVYNGGDFDGKADDYIVCSPGLEYMINQNLFATFKYSLEQLSSSRPDGSFARNRIFVGIRAIY